MFIRSAAALALVLTPVEALAQARSEVLMDLLSRVPSTLIQPAPGDFVELSFADLGAAAATLDPPPEGLPPPSLAAHGPWVRARSPLGRIIGLPDEWHAMAGFGPEEVRAQLHITSAPESGMLLRMADGAGASIATALAGAGYSEETQADVTVFARGDEDNAIDYENVVTGDPFGNGMGRSSRVLVEGDLVVQASAWPLLQGLAGASGPQGHPDLPAVAAALDDPDWGDLRLVNTVSLPHQLDLAPAGSGGLPPWRLGLLADLGSADETLTLVLFTYPSRPEAEAAAARLREGWDDPGQGSPIDAMLAGTPDEAPPARPSLLEITGAPVETGVGGKGPYVAWAALRGTPQVRSVTVGSPAFDQLVQALYRRDLVLFGPP